jgi:hypothetical protein
MIDATNLPAPEVPDIVGEIVCWRAWDLLDEKSSAPRLASPAGIFTNGTVSVDLIWPTNRWMVAACPRDHSVAEIPHVECGCGLYGANSIDDLLQMGYGILQDRQKVIGQVAFAGRFEKGDRATRAQRGRVLRLYVPFTQGDLGERLAAAYNVPFEFGPWWALEKRMRGGS